MSFGKTLDQWENTPGKKTGKKKKVPPGGSPRVKDNWLDSYLPGRGDLKEKETAPPPPVSEGRLLWRRRKPQAVLDLHGLTKQEAEKELQKFIVSLRRRELRKALIIHGKGLHSQEGSVLKPLVKQFLASSPEVGETGRAGRQEGGSGATWFILLQRSR